MRTTERLVIYTLLATLLVAVVAGFRDPTVALAHSAARPGAASPDDLGPTDALILRGSKGDLRVRNGDGRIAWGDRPTERAYSLAFVHVDRIMSAFMEGTRYADARARLEERHEARGKEIQQKRDDFMREFGQVEPGHPDFERAMEAWGSLRKLMESMREEMGKEYEALLKEQIEQAWKEILAAIDVVAERRGIDIVLRFVPATKAFDAEDPEGGIHQLFPRTVLRMPEALDLTGDVMRELNIRDD